MSSTENVPVSGGRVACVSAISLVSPAALFPPTILFLLIFPSSHSIKETVQTPATVRCLFNEYGPILWIFHRVLPLLVRDISLEAGDSEA
jgi:hypothetical protein